MTDSEYAVRNEEYTNIHFVDTFCDGNSMKLRDPGLFLNRCQSQQSGIQQ